MAFENFSDFKDLDDAKLSEEIVSAKKTLFEIRLKTDFLRFLADHPSQNAAARFLQKLISSLVLDFIKSLLKVIICIFIIMKDKLL